MSTKNHPLLPLLAVASLAIGNQAQFFPLEVTDKLDPGMFCHQQAEADDSEPRTDFTMYGRKPFTSTEVLRSSEGASSQLQVL